MTDAPSISVVVPTFRRPAMLAELLPVVLRQITQEAPGAAEAIVVDNCPDASARAAVTAVAAADPDGNGGTLRYVHEPRAGVVHARNAGVAAARGGHVLFLDDDEVPHPGWLRAFLAHARADATLAFGRIVPRYEAPPEPGLEPMLRRLFSRDYDRSDGFDLTRHYVELGTGNALFHKARCFPDAEPFHAAFNRTGGEDIWLIQGFVAQGVPLRWVPEGLVDEVVPADRMTLGYLKRRRFNQGRLRCLFLHRAADRRRHLRVVKWMGVGAAQAGLYGALGGVAALSGHPARLGYEVQTAGGLGKLLWWRPERSGLYGGS